MTRSERGLWIAGDRSGLGLVAVDDVRVQIRRAIRAARFGSSGASYASAVDYTTARAGYLDQLGLALTYPTLGYGGLVDASLTTDPTTDMGPARGVTVANPGIVLTQALSITARGTLLLCAVKKPATVNSVAAMIQVLVDGVDIGGGAYNITAASTGIRWGVLCGHSIFPPIANTLHVGCALLPFNTSLVVNVRFSGAPGGAENIDFRYYAAYR